MSLARHRELLVLGTIRSHPMHGYALVEVLVAGLGRALGLKGPTVYAILKRLAQRGWIRGEAERAGNLPERSVYAVTPEGETAWAELLEHDDEVPSQAPLAALLAQLEHVDAGEQRADLRRLVRQRRQDLAGLAVFDGHPGLSGVAFDLLGQHARVELELLEALLSKT